MKKQRFLRIGCLFLALITLFSFAGCDLFQDGSEGGAEKGAIKIGDAYLDEYTIVYPEDADDSVKAVAVQLQNAVKTAFDLEIPILSDYSKIGAEEGREFLIGATNRSASDIQLRYSDYDLRVDGKKIVFAGGSPSALSEAVDRFIENCFSENGVSLDGLPMEKRETYKYEDVLFVSEDSEVNLKNLSLQKLDGGAAENFNLWLGRNVGTIQGATAKNQIRIARDSSYLLDEISADMADGNLVLTVSPFLSDLTYAFEYFEELVKGNEDDQVELTGEKEVLSLNEDSVITPVEEAGGNIALFGSIDKEPSAYAKDSTVMFSCALLSDLTLVSCDRFTWSASLTKSGTVVANGTANGGMGIFTVQIPTGNLNNLSVTVKAFDGDGEEVKMTAVDGDYTFEILFRDEQTSTSGEYGFWNDDVVQNPTVFAVEDTYQIFVPTNSNEIMYVKVGNKFYYDNACGILKSTTAMHKIVVPMSELNAAGSYTIYSAALNGQRRAYYTQSSSGTKTPVTTAYNFRPVDGDTARIYQIADTHGMLENAKAAADRFKEREGGMDLLILNGDLISSCDELSDFNFIYDLAYSVSGGEIPVIFSRGNHDLRGKIAEKLTEFTPISSVGKTYYTIRLDSLWFILLDAAEDKADSNYEYGGTVAFHQYRLDQIDFLNDVIANKATEYEAAGVKHRMVISHFYFHWDRWRSETEIYDQWVELLNDMEVELCMEGHYHENFIHYPGCTLRFSDGTTRENLADFTTVIGSYNDDKSFGGCGFLIDGYKVTVKQENGSSVTNTVELVDKNGDLVIK